MYNEDPLKYPPTYFYLAPRAAIHKDHKESCLESFLIGAINEGTHYNSMIIILIIRLKPVLC